MFAGFGDVFSQARKALGESLFGPSDQQQEIDQEDALPIPDIPVDPADSLPPPLRLTPTEVSLLNQVGQYHRQKRDNQDILRMVKGGRTIGTILQDTKDVLVTQAVLQAPERIAMASGGDPDLEEDLWGELMDLMENQPQRQQAPLLAPTSESLGISLLAAALAPQSAGKLLAAPFQASIVAQQIKQQELDKEFEVAQQKFQNKVSMVRLRIESVRQRRQEQMQRDQFEWQKQVAEKELALREDANALARERFLNELEQQRREEERAKVQNTWKLQDALSAAATPEDVDRVLRQWKAMAESGAAFDVPPDDAIQKIKGDLQEKQASSAAHSSIGQILNANTVAEFDALRKRGQELSTYEGRPQSFLEEHYGPILDARRKEIEAAEAAKTKPGSTAQVQISFLKADINRLSNQLSGLESDYRNAISKIPRVDAEMEVVRQQWLNASRERDRLAHVYQQAASGGASTEVINQARRQLNSAQDEVDRLASKYRNLRAEKAGLEAQAQYLAGTAIPAAQKALEENRLVLRAMDAAAAQPTGGGAGGGQSPEVVEVIFDSKGNPVIKRPAGGDGIHRGFDSRTGERSVNVNSAQVQSLEKRALGKSYKWGEENLAKGVDCSGLVCVYLNDLGYDAGRVTTKSLFENPPQGFATVSEDNLAAGDIIVYRMDNGTGHTGIVTPDGFVIHASSSAGKVIKTPLDEFLASAKKHSVRYYRP